MSRRGLPAAVAVAALPLAAAAAGPATAAAQQGLPPEVRVEARERAAAILDTAAIPGLAFAVVDRAGLVDAEGLGWADRERRRPVAPSTLFQVGSVTKPLTATLAALLRERGGIGWDERIRPLLWEPGALPDPGITMGQLLGHTAGLPGDPPTLRREHDDYPVLAFTHVELYASLEASELAFAPGTDWDYSNFGYAVAGHALERASDRPFEVLLEDELFAPLGMTSSTVTLWPELRARLATPYYRDEAADSLTRYTPWDPEALAPAGGVASTVEDLGRFVSFLLRAARDEEARLPAEALAAQQSIRHRLSETRGYGMGWFVEDREGMGRVAYHGGGVDGYSAWIEVAPERGVGAVVLVNSGEGPPIVPFARWLLERAAEAAGGG